MARDRRRRHRAAASVAHPPGRPESRTHVPVVGGRRVATMREWRWRTFPVYCTFALTFFVTALIMQLIHPSRGGAAVLVLAAVALGLALAHLVTVGLVFPRLKPPIDS